MKKLMLSVCVMLVILMTACQSMSLPAPTQEEADAYERAAGSSMPQREMAEMVSTVKVTGSVSIP